MMQRMRMSPNCANCDGHVSRLWQRVFGIGDESEVRVCPNCAKAKHIPDPAVYGGGEQTTVATGSRDGRSSSTQDE